jgi:sortase A
MRLMKKQQRRIRDTGQPGYASSKMEPRRRYRTKYSVLVFLAMLVLVGLGAYLSSGPSEETSDGPSDEVDAPVAVEQAPKETAAEGGEDEAVIEAPTDPTMYLTVPKLGIHDVLVLDDVSEEGGLASGAGHLPDTGFPWMEGSNTYIAGHRLGYEGTPSYHVFYDLPSLAQGNEIILRDSLGQVYTYRVSEVLQVLPTDLSVTAPLPGRDVVSLQTCIENFGDFSTLGPNWNVRLTVRADRVG